MRPFTSPFDFFELLFDFFELPFELANALALVFAVFESLGVRRTLGKLFVAICAYTSTCLVTHSALVTRRAVMRLFGEVQ